MGLDWCVQERKNDGGGVTCPAETAGALKLDRDNPKAVEAFREVYNSHCKNALAQTSKSGGAETERLIEDIGKAGFKAFPIEGGSSYQKHWLRPFETVLDDVLAEAETTGRPSFLIDTIPDDSPARAKASGIAVSALDFRGKVIGLMEGLPDGLRARAYEEMDPAQAVALAKSLEEHREQVSDEDKPWLDAAATWLRFWGGHGHGIYAWY